MKKFLLLALTTVIVGCAGLSGPAPSVKDVCTVEGSTVEERELCVINVRIDYAAANTAALTSWASSLGSRKRISKETVGKFLDVGGDIYETITLAEVALDNIPPKMDTALGYLETINALLLKLEADKEGITNGQ